MKTIRAQLARSISPLGASTSSTDLRRALRPFLSPESAAACPRRHWPDLHPWLALGCAERLAVNGRHLWISANLKQALAGLTVRQLVAPIRPYTPKPIIDWLERELHGGVGSTSLHRLITSLYLIHHLDSRWRKMCPTPIIRVGGDLIALCSDAREAASTMKLLDCVLRDSGLNRVALDTADLGDHKAGWLGAAIRLDVGELEVTVHETAWDKLERKIRSEALKPLAHQRVDKVIGAFLRHFAAAAPFTNVRAAYGRIAGMSTESGLILTVGYAEFRRQWLSSHRRWRRFRHRTRWAEIFLPVDASISKGRS